MFANELILRSQSVAAGARTPLFHPKELKIDGTKEHLVGRDGNLNAYDRFDAMQKVNMLVQANATGMLMNDAQAKRLGLVTAADRAQRAKERKEAVLSAYHSPDNRDWQALGADMGNYLYETADREGLMRRLFKRCEVTQGNYPRIPVLYKNVFGFVASSASMIEAQHVRNKFLMPPEIYFEAFPVIGERDLAQSPGDLLEAKLLEAQEATMAAEDRLAFKLINKVVGASNPAITIQGGLTPANLGLMRSQILSWNLPVSTLVFASDLWTDITTNTSFGAFYDPVTQYEIVQTGVLGRILGMQIVSDAFRVPPQKVLNQGQLYLFTEPEYLGGYTDRGPIVANEINASALGLGYPGRGWHMWELLSLALVGGRGVAYAQRTTN